MEACQFCQSALDELGQCSTPCEAFIAAKEQISEPPPRSTSDVIRKAAGSVPPVLRVEGPTTRPTKPEIPALKVGKAGSS